MNESHFILALVQATATNLHKYPHDQEDTITVALTRRDLTLLSAAIPTLVYTFPEAQVPALDLDNRLTELVEVQKPEWLNGLEG